MPLLEMPFGDHLEELRRRLAIGLLGLLPIFVVAVIFGQDLLALLIEPVQNELRQAGLPATLQQTSPVETFGSFVRVVLITTVLAGAPWLLWNVWRFVAPGLYANEKRFVYVLIPMSGVLTVLGVLFLYFVIIPVILSFFIRFGSGIGEPSTPIVDVPAGVVLPTVPVLPGDPPAPDVGQSWFNTKLMQWRVCVRMEGATAVVRGVDAVAGTGIAQQYRVSEYVKLFLSLALAFAIGFQMPVVVLLLGWSGIVDRALLGKYRRHVALVCVLGGALLTPADPVSMVLLAVPLYLLFEFGMILLVLLPAERVSRGIGVIPDDRAHAAGREPPDAGDE